MGIRLDRVGHIGIHVSDVERSIAFYRKVLGLKLTGKWGPPDIRRPICFMRIGDKHHDVVLFELAEDARKAGIDPEFRLALKGERQATYLAAHRVALFDG